MPHTAQCLQQSSAMLQQRYVAACTLDESTVGFEGLGLSPPRVCSASRLLQAQRTAAAVTWSSSSEVRVPCSLTGTCLAAVPEPPPPLLLLSRVTSTCLSLACDPPLCRLPIQRQQQQHQQRRRQRLTSCSAAQQQRADAAALAELLPASTDCTLDLDWDNFGFGLTHVAPVSGKMRVCARLQLSMRVGGRASRLTPPPNPPPRPPPPAPPPPPPHSQRLARHHGHAVQRDVVVVGQLHVSEELLRALPLPAPLAGVDQRGINVAVGLRWAAAEEAVWFVCGESRMVRGMCVGGRVRGWTTRHGVHAAAVPSHRPPARSTPAGAAGAAAVPHLDARGRHLLQQRKRSLPLPSSLQRRDEGAIGDAVRAGAPAAGVHAAAVGVAAAAAVAPAAAAATTTATIAAIAPATTAPIYTTAAAAAAICG